MSCTVQQGTHIRLISPSNIDYQHSCETWKKRVHLFSVYSDHEANYTKIVHFLLTRRNITARFIYNGQQYVSKHALWLLQMSSYAVTHSNIFFKNFTQSYGND